MNTLAEAWAWYDSTKQNLEWMRRLGRKYWHEIPWENSSISKDDDFQGLEAAVIEEKASTSLAPIDDLAVVVLFSVFESLVRSHVVELIEPEASRLTNPILMDAAVEAIKGVEEGSFYLRVLEPLKVQKQVSGDLITQVNQVRDYRNWVAHGRRGRLKNYVDPKAAYDRLGKFLETLGISVEVERNAIDPPTGNPREEAF